MVRSFVLPACERKAADMLLLDALIEAAGKAQARCKNSPETKRRRDPAAGAASEYGVDQLCKPGTRNQVKPC